MEVLNALVQFIQKLVQWWFVVMPWEQAIHVRRGKKVRVKNKGLYFKIPFVDRVYVQTTRMRTVEIPMQTISSQDGTSITIKSFIGYSIENIFTLYKTLYHPEATICSIATGMISEFIRERNIADIDSKEIEKMVNEELKKVDYGLKDIHIRITTFTVVKTFRLIQDHSYMFAGDLDMNSLK